MSPGLQVLLSADLVGFGQPRAEVLIDVAQLHEPERVQVIARRERLDAAEARVIETSGQHHVPVQPAAPRRHLREGHPHLEGDPRLLRQNLYRADRSDSGHYLPIQRANRRRLAAEVMRERVPAARVRLIAVGEDPPAFAAAPQRWFGHQRMIWDMP